MKIPRLEILAHRQRQFHKANQWNLSHDGLYVPHSYNNETSDNLSYWDDVGFILNGRRIIVWWQHPRHVYLNALNERAWLEVGDCPSEDRSLNGAPKTYKMVGARKKHVGYMGREASTEQQQHFRKLHEVIAHLSLTGIDFDVSTSCKSKRLPLAMGVSLIAPLEVHSEIGLKVVAALARRLLVGATTLNAEFPGYSYSRSEWLSENR